MNPQSIRRIIEADGYTVTDAASPGTDGLRVTYALRPAGMHGRPVNVSVTVGTPARSRSIAVDIAQLLTRHGFVVTTNPHADTLLSVADPLGAIITRRAHRTAFVALINGRRDVHMTPAMRTALTVAGLLTADGTPDTATLAGMGVTVRSHVARTSDNAARTFPTSGAAYDASQSDDTIRNGDVIHVPSERVVGVLVGAWPVAVTLDPGEFHFIYGYNVTGWLADINAEHGDDAGAAVAAGVIAALDIAIKSGYTIAPNFEFLPASRKCWWCGEKRNPEMGTVETINGVTAHAACRTAAMDGGLATATVRPAAWMVRANRPADEVDPHDDATMPCPTHGAQVVTGADAETVAMACGCVIPNDDTAQAPTMPARPAFRDKPRRSRDNRHAQRG